MQEKIEKYVQEYEKNAERLVREYKIMKIFSWVSLLLILMVLILFIAKSSFAASCPSGQVQNYKGNCVSINQAASEADNPYGGSGASNLSGLISYGKNNISLTPSSCTNSSNFLNVEYSVTSSGDINAIVQMNTNNGSGYNYSYSIPVLISGVCSNGIISCPAGEWYGGGITCNNYAIQYSPSTGFSLEPLGASIMGTPQSTSVNVPLNGTQVSTVTSTQTSGGLADCIDINDATGSTPASETEVQQVLTDLGGQITSAIQKGSSDIIGGVSQNTANSPYSATYSGGTCSNSNYNSANNLEGLYNQGGSALNNEVSSSEVATANSNLQSSLGMSTTPQQMLINTQIATFGNTNSGGLCQIQNEANADSCTIAPDLVLTGSWNIGNYESNGCANGCTCGSGSGSTDTTTLSSSEGGMNNVINAPNNNNGSNPASISGSLTFAKNGQIQGSIGLDTFGCGWSFPTCMYGEGNTIETSNSCSGSITYNPTTETFSGTINIPTNTGTDTLSASGDCITASQGGSICVKPDGSSPTCAGINIPANNDGVFTNFTYYYVLYQRIEDTCGDTSGCTLESEQVCNQDDKDCQYLMKHGSTVAPDPDITWTESQADQNLNPPSPNITWTISMDGSSVQATPSETEDTTGYSGNLATSSNNSLYPTVNEIWDCQTNSPFNFTKMNEQETAVTCQSGQKCQACPTCPVVTGTASVNSNNTAFSYTGVNGNQHNNISINNTVNDATQEECVVQQTTTNASVSSSVQATTATQNTPTSDTTTNTETLNCTNTGTINNPSWNCPVPNGYTIQTNCTAASNINNNNFAPAMVELQVLDKAGSSLICSAN